MAKKTQFDQAQHAANNILIIMKRTASEMTKDAKLLEEALGAAQNPPPLGTADGSIDAVNFNVFVTILRDAQAFAHAAGQERRIIASTPLGRRR